MAQHTKQIYEHSEWPEFRWSNDRLINRLAEVRHHLGVLYGKTETFGEEFRKQLSLEVLASEIMDSVEFSFRPDLQEEVRATLAFRLGLDSITEKRPGQGVDTVVAAKISSAQEAAFPITEKMLYEWHRALFPKSQSGMYSIIVGKYRDDSTGPAQVISGSLGRERIHFQAPAARMIEHEVEQFLEWVNGDQEIDIVIKAAVAHLWFVTIHPFEDGNGRVAQLISDRILAKASENFSRYFSISEQINESKEEYYHILEETQIGGMDISAWIEWYLNCMLRSIKAADTNINKVVFRQNFWLNTVSDVENSRQKRILNMMLEGTIERISTSKWGTLCHCSHDTALRDIQHLMDRKIIQKLPEGGRSTGYILSKELIS